jgi:hypothetical protein
VSAAKGKKESQWHQNRPQLYLSASCSLLGENGTEKGKERERARIPKMQKPEHSLPSQGNTYGILKNNKKRNIFSFTLNFILSRAICTVNSEKG